jgi:hypothetical protein
MIIGDTGDSGIRHRDDDWVWVSRLVNVTDVNVVVIMLDEEEAVVSEFFDFSSTPMSTPASI